LLGKHIDFVPSENWPETIAAIEQMLSGQKIQLFETRHMTKEGRVLDVQLSSTLYHNETASHVVISRDISYLINLTFIKCLTKEIISDR
jgi:hypothetical protein